MGGLARKASIINQEKSKGSHVLVFDTGDVFFLDKNKYNDDTRKIHAEIIAKSYNMIGCNSLSPGLRDVSEFGFSYLDSLSNALTTRILNSDDLLMICLGFSY